MFLERSNSSAKRFFVLVQFLLGLIPLRRGLFSSRG
jgi:hypothetical protein